MSSAEHYDSNRDNAFESSSWWSSWNDSHLRTCQERRSLAAPPQQVLDYTNTNTNPDATDVVFWSLPDRCNVVEWALPNKNNEANHQQLIKEVCNRFGNHTLSTPTKQSHGGLCTPETLKSGGLLQSVTKTFTATLTPLWGALTPGRKAPPPNSRYMQEEDDALRDWSSPLKETDASHHEATKSGLLAWNQPVLNPSLTRICFEILQKELESACTTFASSSPSSASSSFPQVVSRRRNTSAAKNTNGVGSSWKDWLNRIDPSIHDNTKSTMPMDLLARLSITEADFLLECMAEMGHVTIIASDPKSGIPKEELVVLGGNLRQDTRSMTSEEISMYQHVLASWWELSTAQESLERRREQWSLQAQEYSQRALKERQAKLGSGLASFKIHKLFLQRLEESGGTLLNLEQARHTLEESWHQRQVVQALETSTRTLQTLRQDTEEIDELMESYREEVEHVESVQESLSATILGDNAFDEDELMKDLERLTLLDDNIQKGAVHPAPTPTAAQDTPEKSISTESKKNTTPSSAPNAGESRQPERVMLPE